jgi:hypothetical protein
MDLGHIVDHFGLTLIYATWLVSSRSFEKILHVLVLG